MITAAGGPPRRVLTLLLGLAASGAVLSEMPRPAAAQEAGDVVYRRMGFAEHAGQLVLTASFADILGPADYARLSSGLTTTVAVRVYVYRHADTEQPVSLSVYQLELVYDLWDEVYVVRIRGPSGDRQTRVKSRADAARAITWLQRAPVAPLGRIPIGPHHFVAMVVELNPVSPELLAEMRRWLSKPAGQASVESSSSSFFGSLVSVFVNPKLEAADRVLHIRSQPFYRTPR